MQGVSQDVFVILFAFVFVFVTLKTVQGTVSVSALDCQIEQMSRGIPPPLLLSKLRESQVLHIDPVLRHYHMKIEYLGEYLY